MDKNFNFLTTINGIYNLNEEAAELNYFDTLLIYFNDNECIFKINYTRLIYDNYNKNNKININKGEIILNDIGEMEYELIYNNFYNNLIKELIFNKYLDYIGDHLNYDKIY